MNHKIKTYGKYAAFIGIGILMGALFFGHSQKMEHGRNQEHDHSKHALETSDKPAEETVWTCSMHPQIKLPKPGKCPICGMDLIPLKSDGEESGPRTLSMSETDKKLAEVVTSPIKRMEVNVPVSMVGKVILDETKVKTITSWFPYRIDRLFVDYTGIKVREGDHLAEIYSPDLLTAQEELLEAVRHAGSTSKGESEFMKNSNVRALESAKEKLRLWGLLPWQIKEIIDRGNTSDHMVINAPVGGTVIHKGVKEGEYAKIGTKIFTIADLTHLWVLLDAYETDLPWIRYGQSVTFQTEAYPGESFQGTITFIDPILNKQSRTVKVRVHVDNKDQKLKPEMFVRATIMSQVAQSGRVMAPHLEGKWICPMHPEVIKDTSGQCGICEMDLVKAGEMGFKAPTETELPLVIPETAVLRTGKRSVVYVKVKGKEKPTYEGKEILLGPRAGKYFIVLEGLSEGEEVVVQGNFKIDSALQIQAKPSMMSMTGDIKVKKNSTPSVFSESLNPLYDLYFEISEAMAADHLEHAASAFMKIMEALKATKSDQLTESSQTGEWRKQAKAIENSMHQVHQSKDKASLRQAFWDLSNVMIQVQKIWGHGSGMHYQAHCPMALDGKGGDWLQRKEEVNNPYFGSEMLYCGSVEKKFTPMKGGN